MTQSPLTRYLETIIASDASDLYLTVGSPPIARGNSGFKALDKASLDDAAIECMLDDLTDAEQRLEFKRRRELNLALDRGAGARFRVNIFQQRHHTGMVIRRIPTKIPSFAELGLPKIVGDFALEARGLVLVVGATGSGKSTTLAAMLDYRNDTKPGHIVTVEDPIEFIHEHKKCLVTQREIGIDTESYQAALKNALRQRPDTILIGEIRDAEVMEHAIVFAETGHLCMATLHANNANQALERILNFFPESRHPQVCLNLAYNLRAVIAQRLVQGEPEGRIPALEILNNDGLVRELIRTNQHDKIKEAMERSSASGSQTFDQALFNLVAQRAISESTALSEADCVADLELKLRQSRIGGQVDGLAGLDTSQISFL